MVLLGQRDRLGAVLRLADDLELGPDLGQARAQLLAQQPLVVGDDRSRGEGRLCRGTGATQVRARSPAAGCGQPPDQPADEQRTATATSASEATDRRARRWRCRSAPKPRPRRRRRPTTTIAATSTATTATQQRHAACQPLQVGERDGLAVDDEGGVVERQRRPGDDDQPRRSRSRPGGRRRQRRDPAQGPAARASCVRSFAAVAPGTAR